MSGLESVQMLPLTDRRVLVTRARGQASGLAAQLEALGAEAIVIPAIEIAPPASYCGLDAALSSLRAYDWVIFTSANAVHALVERGRQLRVAAAPRRIAVIGPATAKAVEERGFTVDLMPAKYVAEELARALAKHASGASMLLVRAAVARDVLPEELSAAGAVVSIAEAYRNIVPAGSVERLREMFRGGAPDAVTFTSASTAQHLAGLMEAAEVRLPEGVVLASIGPITSAAMRELGLEPRVEAAEATIPALVAALGNYFEASASAP